MKIFKIITFICLTSLFVSCDNSEDIPNVNVSEEQLVGTWNLTKLDIDGTANIPGVPIGVPVKGVGKNLNAKIVIIQQPNNITASGNFIVTVTLDIPGSAVTQDIPFNLDALVGNGTWSLNNNGQFIITDNVGSQTFDIKEFNDSILKIRTQEEISIPYNETTIVVDATIDMTLQRS